LYTITLGKRQTGLFISNANYYRGQGIPLTDFTPPHFVHFLNQDLDFQRHCHGFRGVRGERWLFVLLILMELLTVKLLNFLFIASFIENTAHIKTKCSSN